MLIINILSVKVVFFNINKNRISISDSGGYTTDFMNLNFFFKNKEDAFR